MEGSRGLRLPAPPPSAANVNRMAEPSGSVSTWSPLRIGVFRAMWIAVLVANIGTWMQTVGAQWLLVHLPHAAILVALVQTADFLPDVLFALVGGALADVFDRRRLLIVVQLIMASVGGALTVLTFAGQMPPALLLVFTFALGCSSVFTNPAYQSLVPELVPRHQLRAASSLASISINLARLIGPALAGLLIARTGVAAVFALNALTYVFFAAVLVVIVLLPPGAAWIAVLSDINAELQLFLPAWVRARGLSVYQMVLFGAQGLGAVVWGAISEPFGVRAAFVIASAAMLAGLVSMRFWPFLDTAGMERRTTAYWPEPQLAFDAKLDSGPVVAKNTYTIAHDKDQAFLEAMARLRQSRLRTGATRWGLFRDGEVAQRFVEPYAVPSWDEHLRQHRYRITGTDPEYEEQADVLSDPPSEVSHLIAVDDLP